jgi:hypothetical protein
MPFAPHSPKVARLTVNSTVAVTLTPMQLVVKPAIVTFSTCTAFPEFTAIPLIAVRSPWMSNLGIVTESNAQTAMTIPFVPDTRMDGFCFPDLRSCRTLAWIGGQGGRDATRAPNQARNGWRPSGRLLVKPAAPSKRRPNFVQPFWSTSINPRSRLDMGRRAAQYAAAHFRPEAHAKGVFNFCKGLAAYRPAFLLASGTDG